MNIFDLNFPNFQNMKIPQINDMSSFMNRKQWKDGNMMDIEEMTSEDFLKLISNTGEIYLGNSEKITKVTGKVEVGPGSYKLKTLILENFEFVDTVSFFGQPNIPVNIGDHLFFKDCVFRQPLIFNYCISSDTAESDFRQQGEAIQIINGFFNLIKIANCKFPFGVSMYSEEGNKLEIDWLYSTNNIFTKAGYDLEYVSFKSKVYFSNDHFENKGIEFNNCTASSPIGIYSIISPGILFTGNESNFQKKVEIRRGEITGLFWNGGTFKEEVNISGVSVEKHLSLIGTTFSDRFQIRWNNEDGGLRNSPFPNDIALQDCSFNNGFEIIGGKSKANLLQINFSEKSSGVIDIQDTFFQEVTLKGNNFNNSVFLRGCSYDKLAFQHFFNKGQLSFSNNSPHLNDGIPKELKIEHSNLGNTEFYDFDFSIYPVVSVINSRVDNVFAFGVKWFRKKQLFVDEQETSPAEILSQKREIYRQLRFAAEKQSDRVTSLFFKAREIQLHKKVLKNRKKLPSSGIADKINNWFEKYSDLASISLGYTNNHGQNWIYPLLWIIGITLAFYPFLMILLDSEITFAWDWSPEGWNLFWDKFGEHSHAIPQLFNPARRLSDLFGNTASFMLQLLDSLQRIVLAFFIFQIVSAFRKFVK